ncbi:MAG: hypothetical protein ACREMG_09640, partial [Gemmatimonadales bacterium]
MSTIEKRLPALGLTLPAAKGPVANYLGTKRSGPHAWSRDAAPSASWSIWVPMWWWFRREVADAAGGEVLVERAGTDVIRFGELRLGTARFEAVTAGAYDTLDVDGVLGYNVLRHA